MTTNDLPAPPSSRGTAASGTLEERLSSLLNSSQFTVASYLNLALKGQPQDDGDEIQRRMAELALQLQLQTQACHEDIGRIGAELQAILPRCAADVGRVGVGLEGMKIDAAALLDATHSTTSDEVSSSMETLSTLHALRTNLGRTKEILQAAATWDSTLSSIAPLLAQQNLTEAVSALAQLESGERALRGMPSGKRERQEAIAKTRSQIQVLLQPQLKHALQNMHTRLAPLQQCVSLYSALGTMETLQEEYVKNRPGSIHKAWFSYTPSYDKQGDEAEEKEGATPPSLVTFLPIWFDAVLSLLAEERRQSYAVFGPDLAPGMITKVLYECFRPILSSFQSRLDSLYSSQESGSLQSICAVYEATLEFLSLAYESVAGSWLDVAETTSVSAQSQYEDVTAVVLQIASPFASFQERLPSLEEKHSGVARQLIAKDIQQAARSATTSLSTLQDATERLQDLSPFIFPLAEGAIGRFELLNGGYRPNQALSTVDKLLSSHAGELAIAVRTLSATMTADENHLAENFDEQHVLCALQVLKVAGTFLRDLRTFEGKTRERIGLLTERMSASQAQEKELQEAIASKSSSFLLPDSLSVVEVDSMLTKAVWADSSDAETDATLSVLQRLASVDSPVALYPESEDSVAKLASSCHSFVFDICSAVPRKQLNGMSTMTAWTESSGAVSLDSYGTLPQSYITQVGEHMLALVQALEPFASDTAALELAKEVMGGVKSVAHQPWHEFLAAAGASDSMGVLETLMNGKELDGYVITGGLAEEDEDLEEGEEDDESAKFCNSWLDVVSLAVTGRLLERILRIQQLTAKGCDHLAADLNYLINVLSALGVSGHPHPLVNHFVQVVSMDDASLREQIGTRDRSNPVLAALRAAEVRIALIRGVSAN